MIFFKPVPCAENSSIIEFQAIENDVTSGKCTLNINGDKAEITDISCDDKKLYLVEGLIRSAFNYAALNGCYMGYCKVSRYTQILDSMNFSRLDGVYCNDIPSILTGNCCKKH